MWLLPISLLVATTILAVPLSRYLAWIMNGKYHAPAVLRWFEHRVDSGPQTWKQYILSLLVFQTTLFVFGFAILSLQPLLPLNTLNRGMLEPTTIFHSVMSFMTNTDLQHYSGDQAFSNFSQLFFCVANFFLSASIGFCALAMIVRCFRGDATCGNFFVDMWRVVMYMFLPVALVLGIVFVQQGSPMTLASSRDVTTVESGAMGTADDGSAKAQTIVLGPVAAFIPIKQLGTNGGGFYGMNNAHPFESPTAVTNWLSCMAMMLFPFSLVLMYGRMLGRLRHGWVIFSVMMVMMIGTIVWSIRFDTLEPNPGLTAHAASQPYQIADASAPGGKRELTVPPAIGLPVDQHLGNLEGKELRFGTSAWGDVRRDDGRRHLRGRQLRTRQPQPGGGVIAHGRYVAELHFRWQGSGNDQFPALPHRGPVHRRADGGPFPGVPRQEDRPPRSGACSGRHAGPPDHDSWPDGLVRGHKLGPESHEQSRAARVLADYVPVLFRVSQQRFRV